MSCHRLGEMNSQVVLIICDLLTDHELAVLSTCSSELYALCTDNAVYAPRYHRKFGPNKLLSIPGRAAILYRQVMMEVRKLHSIAGHRNTCSSLTALQYFAKTTGLMPETSLNVLVQGRIDIVEWIHSYGIRIELNEFGRYFRSSPIPVHVLRWLEAHGELMSADFDDDPEGIESYCLAMVLHLDPDSVNKLFDEAPKDPTSDKFDAIEILLQYKYRPRNHIVYKIFNIDTSPDQDKRLYQLRDLLVQYRCFPEIYQDMGYVRPTANVISFMIEHGHVFTLDHVYKALEKNQPELAPLILSAVKMDQSECCDRFIRFKDVELLQKLVTMGGHYSELALSKAVSYGECAILQWLVEDLKFPLTASLYEDALYDTTASIKRMIIDDKTLDIVFYLLDRQIPINAEIGRQLAEKLLGDTFLPHISIPPKWDTLRRLSTYGIKPKIYKGEVSTKTCQDINVAAVRTMLENGVYPFLVKTELACAVKEGRDDLVQLYEEFGVKLSRTKCIIHEKPV